MDILREVYFFIKAMLVRSNRVFSALFLLLIIGLLGLRISHSKEIGVWVAKNAAYWLCLCLMTVFCYIIYKVCKAKSNIILGAIFKNYLGLIFSFVLGFYWLAHEPWVDRVLFDEYVYTGVSYMMHQVREAVIPAKAHFIDGVLYVISSGPDKRSCLYPFLASILHDLTGFRVQNMFIISGIAGLLVLPLIYITNLVLFSPRVAVLGVLLWFSYGLMPAHVNSAGYDILNLLFLQGWLLLAVLSLKRSSACWWEAFFVTSICLALVRNEAVFFLFGTIVICYVRFKERKVLRFSWPMLISALALLIPVAANLNFSNFKMGENVNGQLFLSITHLPENFISALYFILQISTSIPNQPLLGALGILSGLFFLVNYFGRRKRKEMIACDDQVLFVFSGCVGLCYILYLSSFWGDWNDPMVSRFSITPFYWLLIMACWLINRCAVLKCWVVGYKIFLSLILVFTVVRLPALHSGKYTQYFTISREMEFLKRYLHNIREKRIFLVSDGTANLIPSGYAGIWVGNLAAQAWRMQTLFDFNLYDEVLIADRFVLSKKSGKWEPDRMAPEAAEYSWYHSGKFEYELVEEYFSTWTSSLRIYKLKSVANVAEARKQRTEHLENLKLQDASNFVKIMNTIP